MKMYTRVRILCLCLLAGSAPVLSGNGTQESETGNSGEATSAADTLPEGPGREAVMKGCVGACHDANVLIREYSADEWVSNVNEMIGLGAQIPDEDYVPIITYLVRNISPKTDQP